MPMLHPDPTLTLRDLGGLTISRAGTKHVLHRRHDAIYGELLSQLETGIRALGATQAQTDHLLALASAICARTQRRTE